MLKITLLTVGKIKEKYFNDAIAEYSKRLGRYCKLNIIEVADEKTPDDASEAEEELIKKREGDRILAKLPDNAYVCVLAINGKNLSSTELADKMSKICVSGYDHIVFIIGGSLGLSEDVNKKADMLLSFSRMTFPHQLMRVVLLEQIYRGFRILNNEPYHK
ncbi:MAG: 23S rRNA (pseudouridine(1915)-N(3))-methyltransferase RlmH [Lachnospiraceae bacterium]|nr:23S rRNA (pseudouridine(1915)-N(3))-methyltransferase RlmH [Lachnospiraceae bacterium]